MWEEYFQKSLILVKFHQFLCEDNNRDFKDLFREKKLPNDPKGNRVIRFLTIIQKICDQCEWHKNYEEYTIQHFKPYNRSYLFSLGINVFDCLQELTTGPNLENQRILYTLLYDRYLGILKRFDHKSDSLFYSMKV